MMPEHFNHCYTTAAHAVTRATERAIHSACCIVVLLVVRKKCRTALVVCAMLASSVVQAVGQQSAAERMSVGQQGEKQQAEKSEQRGKEVVVSTSEGTEFWLCFQKNYTEPELTLQGTIRQDDALTLELFIAASEDAKVLLEIDGLLFKREVTVRGGTVLNVKIDTTAQIRSSEKIERLALHVRSTKPVSVYGLNHRFMTTDTYLGLPVTALGQEYRIMSYEKLRDDLISQFAVIATEDKTSVTINPSTQTLGGKPKGVPFTVMLNKGDVYNVIAAPGRRNAKSDLTGTLVQSDKNIAVFGSHSGAYIPNNEKPGCNHLVEQMPPVAYWGRHYYVGMLAQCTRSVYRVLAAENHTTVFANSQRVAVLNAGEYYENDNATENVQITADKRILVSQYSIGFKNGQGKDFRDSLGDPMMLLITPTQQFLKKYRIATPVRGDWNHYFNIVVPRTGVASMRIDGKPIKPSEFKPFGDSRYMIAQLEVNYGTHVVEGAEPFGLYSYGFGYGRDSYDAYGNMGGQSFLQVLPPRDTLPPMADMGQSVEAKYPSAKLFLRDDREDDKGLETVRVLGNDGMVIGNAEVLAGMPQASLSITPRSVRENGRAVVEARDVAGNSSVFTVCYLYEESVPTGYFALSEGDNPVCPRPSSWFVGVFGALSMTSHRVDFGSVGGFQTAGRFSDLLASQFFPSGGGAMVTRKFSSAWSASARLSVEGFPGILSAPDSTAGETRAGNQIVVFQEGRTLAVTSPYLSLALTAEWYLSPAFYLMAGFKGAVPLTRSVEFTRRIITPQTAVYQETNSAERKEFQGSWNALQGFVPFALGGVGVSVPVWRSWSVFGEALYTHPLASLIAGASWQVSQISAQLGVKLRL